ncbi:tail completion protein gp17 [Sphingomonas morindae]|uniref:DUF3168 domain-containing protein n=1 Tax=Sphingomonas morindae TaxID=1541170 RepID=A0ABY4X3K8_9SPHN|nr:DUF3168 domain-containing protein [Sphingomonas morindae]USI71472.1 DUF3168 domain-containing protein [Sphingomonas morindae]
MTAAEALQSALVAALSPILPVHDGPPRRAGRPYIEIAETLALDWGTKDRPGRELRLSLLLWDERASPARLHALAGRVEAAVAALPRALPGHRLASLVLLRALLVRPPAGPWAARQDWRARLLAEA